MTADNVSGRRKSYVAGSASAIIVAMPPSRRTRPTRRHFLSLFYAPFVLFVVNISATEYQETLSAELAMTKKRRSGAPSSIDVKLVWRGAEIATGALEVDFQGCHRRLARHRLPDLALAPGANVYQVSVPPLSASIPEARLWFVAADGPRIELGTHFGLRLYWRQRCLDIIDRALGRAS